MIQIQREVNNLYPHTIVKCNDTTETNTVTKLCFKMSKIVLVSNRDYLYNVYSRVLDNLKKY